MRGRGVGETGVVLAMKKLGSELGDRAGSGQGIRGIDVVSR